MAKVKSENETPENKGIEDEEVLNPDGEILKNEGPPDLEQNQAEQGIEVSDDLEKMVSEAEQHLEVAEGPEQSPKPQGTQTSSKYLGDDDASMYALECVKFVANTTSKLAGHPIKVTKKQAALSAALLRPLMQKHGKMMLDYIEGQDIDLESNQPEYMAAGGVAVIAGPTLFDKFVSKRKKKGKKAKAEEEATEEAEESKQKLEQMEEPDNGGESVPEME